jgi:plastocyanin
MYQAIILGITAILIIGGFLTFNKSSSPVEPSTEVPRAVPTTDNVLPEPVVSNPDNSQPTAPTSAPVKTSTVKAPIITITPAPTATVTAAKEFTVTGSNFAYAPNMIKVKKGDKVRIIFKNADGFHDLKIDELGVDTGKIQGGSEKTVEFTADKAGAFEYYCSVGSHRQMGMKGTLVVE